MAAVKYVIRFPKTEVFKVVTSHTFLVPQGSSLREEFLKYLRLFGVNPEEYGKVKLFRLTYNTNPYSRQAWTYEELDPLRVLSEEDGEGC